MERETRRERRAPPQRVSRLRMVMGVTGCKTYTGTIAVTSLQFTVQFSVTSMQA
jgi:hypothetical protein